MMKVTITELPAADSDGKVNKTTIDNYHCISCGLFILSTVDARRSCKQNKPVLIDSSRT
jgi:hypothetical protein